MRRIADVVAARYVHPDIGRRIAAHLTAGVVTPDPAEDPESFAEAATTHLRALNGDRHLSVRHCPEGVEDEQDEAIWKRLYAAEARANAGGISTLSRDPQTVTLVISPYLSPVEHGRPFIDAALRLIDGAESLIICRGGTPDAVAHLCSYFLGPDAVHLQDVVARGGSVERFATAPNSLDAPPQFDLPIAVLTGATTFSGGEDLAYTLQALHRATIVGERTAGGAHPRQAFALTSNLEVHVPVARSVNAVTGSNWETTGVVPDLTCDAHEAPARAAQALAGRTSPPNAPHQTRRSEQ